MRRCDYLNRAAGVKGWEDLPVGDDRRYTLEKIYERQLKRRNLLQVTSLAVVDGQDVDNQFSEEGLRAQIFNWSSLPEEVVMYDSTEGKEVTFVVLNSLKYGQSNRAAEEKLERERSRDLPTAGGAPVTLVGPVERSMPVNCGTKRRKLNVKRTKERAALEQARKRKRRAMQREENQRKSVECSGTPVDVFAAFNGRGKSVSKSAVDMARVKLLGEKYDSKAHHGGGMINRSVQKILCAAPIGVRKKSPHFKTCKKLSQDEVSAEQQGRRKWNSGWRRVSMFEIGVQRKAKPASQAAGNVGGESLAAVNKDAQSGENMIAGLLDSLIDDALDDVELSKGVEESEEVNHAEDDMCIDEEDKDEEITNGGLTDSENEDEADETDGALSDGMDVEKSPDEQVAEVNENVAGSVLRLRGGGEVWLADDFGDYCREEVIERLLRLNVDVDYNQTTERLQKQLQQLQLSEFIAQHTPSTVLLVLKKYNLPWKKKDRREATLKMHFLRNPDLQQCILDDITACSMMSPVSSEAESDGQFSGPPSASEKIRSPATPSFTASPHTPANASPVTPGPSSDGEDQLWTMSRAELISFLDNQQGTPSHSRQPTDYYRTRVGIIMVERLLQKLNNIDALTKVLENLNVDYCRSLSRRADRLRSYFTKKEAGKEEMMRKQMAVLRELQVAVARSKGSVFSFPSAYSPSDFASPPLPTTSNAHLSQQSVLQPPPPKRKRMQSPGIASTAHTAPHTVALVAQGDQVMQAAQVRFNNPSTFCYLNGLLNLLFSNPEFMRVLFAADTERQLSDRDNGGVDILKELKRLSQIPVTGDIFYGNGVPGEFGDVSYLKQLLGNQWAEDSQEDAHDLFTELYTRLSCASFENLFAVIFQTVRKCLGPNCQSALNEETFSCVCLPPQGTMNMLNLFASLTDNELVPYNCECGIDQSNRRKEIMVSGTAMLVVLERYRFGGAEGERNDAPISVPLSMFLHNKWWHLTGALKNSSGNNSASHGHYTGIRRDAVTGHFFCNNDYAPLEKMHTTDAMHFINQSYMFMYCLEEALPGQRAPPIPTEEGPGGDQLAGGLQTDAHVRGRKVVKGKKVSDGRKPVDGTGDHASAASTGHGDRPENLNTAAGVESAFTARKKTAGNRKRKQLADDFFPPDNVQAKMRQDAEARRVHLEARHARIQRDDFSLHDLPPNPLLENILAYEAELNKLTFVQCVLCKEKLFDEKLTRQNMCQRCHNDDKRRAPEEVRMWSVENNMHVDDEVPAALSDLTPVEQSAIQRMFVVMKIYRLARGATFLKGHCLTVNQDLAEFVTRLPPRPADLPMIFLIGPNQRVPLKANSRKILRALEWLKEHNEFYRDIEIDFEALNAYPSNDNENVQGLNTVASETVDEEADPADVYTGEEGIDMVYSSIQSANPSATVKEEIRRYVLSHDETNIPNLSGDESDIPNVEWPRREKKPADENTRGAFSMMFPWLFPTGAGDYTVMGPAGRPQFLAWLRHLLNHESRRFANDQRFIHYGGNRHQKQQALSLGFCYVNYRNTDITLEELKEQIANNNLSTFASLLYFSRSIVGSRQFFKYEGKKSLSLVNFIHIMSDMKETMNLFVTLSFADQHDPALHRLLPGSERYLNKIVVNLLADIPQDGSPSDYILASEDHRLRTEAVEKNGDIVCHYLDKKLWLFFEHVLKPLGVIDYILRVEFQYRSSEHFHMVLRLLDGVSVDTVHRAFSLSEFEVEDIEKIGALPPEEQARIAADHERTLDSRRQVADFSTFRLGQTAIHPQKDPKQWPGKEGLNIQRPRVHCSRRQFSDVVNDPTKQTTFPFQVPRGKKRKQPVGNILADEAIAQRILDDAILCVNRLQLHNCTARYCLKIVLGAMMLCKFHFPLELEGFSAELIDVLYNIVYNEMADHPGTVFKGNELTPARNHPRLVVTISEFIIGWRGNNNTRFVQSVHQLIDYVLKYIMKVTAGSKSFENTVKDITNQASDNDKVSSVFQKLLMRNITEHDLSRTEAFRLILGKALVFYSRDFRPVNLMGLRQVVNDVDGGDGELGADRKATKDNRADLYWRRHNDDNFASLVENYEAGEIELPYHPQEINLYMYVALFESNWTPSRKTYVPVPSPLHKYPPDPREPKAAENRKDYLRSQLLLFQPGMRPSLLPDDLEAAMHEFVKTDHCPRLIGDAFLKSWEKKKDTDAVQPDHDPLLEDPELPAEADIEQDPFMAGLGATISKVDCNNTNLIDEEEECADGLMQEHAPVHYTGIATDMSADWSSDRLQLGLNCQQIDDAAQWLESRKAVTEVPNQVWTDQFDPDALNEKQREVFNLMERLVMGDTVEPGIHLIDVNGEAGTGKSRLIKTILYQSEVRSGQRSRIRVCAFTNSAAYQFIGGKTAHRLFRLDVERGPKGTRCRSQAPLEGKRLQDFQEDFAETRAIIIDEKSMIGCFDLWRIDQRLRQARPSHADQMFGGMVVLLCGDLSQLPPVGDKPLYYNGTGVMTGAQSQGRALYAQFRDCYFLTESMRQQGPENEMFRGELQRLANGTFTIDDWHRWEERSFERLPQEEQVRFHTEGVKLCARNVDKVAFNEDGLKRCNTPILVVKAENNNTTAQNAKDADGELPNYVPVAKGASVVLTDNLWPDMGLMNGSKGTVTHIVFQEGKHPGNSMPHFIVVTFPGYIGPPYLAGHPGTVPICPRTAEWKDGTTRCTRRSFPLIPGYALTIHKSQGMTIDEPVIIDGGPLEFASGLTYTVCTRTRSLANVAFHPMPTFNRIRDIFKDSFKAKELEVARRKGLAAEREAAAALAASNGVKKTAAKNEPPVSQPPPTGTVPVDLSVTSQSPAKTTDDDAADSHAESQRLFEGDVCSYPLDDRGALNVVSMHDYRLLGCNEQLNDILVKLGLDYFERTILSTEQRTRLYVFNSGRFERFIHELSEDQFACPLPEDLARLRHARVAEITRRRSIDLFAKDIVLWPIERSNHWYLVVGLNLGKPNAAIFALNSAGNFGEGAILEHIKAYLALEYDALPNRDGHLPAIKTLASAPPQQTGGIDCGLYLLNSAAAIFRRFDQLSALSNSENLGQNWFPPFSTLQMRQMFANLIRKLSAEQDIGVTSWPDLNLN